LLASLGQFPVGQQFIFVDFDPSLNHFQLFGRKTTRQHASVINRESRFIACITHMDVSKVMPVRVLKEHGDQDSVEHADAGHGRIVWGDLLPRSIICWD
jgi:hypothetical protein